MANEIPPMTHEYGRYWDQPPRDEILVDDFVAVMTRKTFDQLMAYDHTNPSGVYPGKMWSRTSGRISYLVWYEQDEDPNYCKTQVRQVLLV